MSELKGQLLGLLIVLAVFGVIKTVVVPMFQKTATDISSKIGEEVSAAVVVVTPDDFEIAL
jgi:competence protein ComGC